MKRLLGAVLPLALLAASTLSAQEVRRPNVVFILADDLGYAEVGAFGQREIRTPNLDRLAREGMRLTQFYSASPVCAPARCGAMTGMHTGHCRVRNNGAFYLRDEDLTVAEVLRPAGYVSGAFGKWGLAKNNWDDGSNETPEAYPTQQGFDRFFGYINQRHAHNFYPTFLISDEDTVRLPNVVPDEGRYGEGDATEEVVYSQDRILQESLDFIRQNRDRPFFAYLAFTLPHINNEGQNAPDGGFEVPDLGIYADKPWPSQHRSYAAFVTRLDTDVGRVMALLAELGLEEETLVFFSSDNGATGIDFELEPGRVTEAGEWFDGNGPFRGLKGQVFEGGIRVPTIARWPGVIAPGTESAVQGYFPDLLPTFAELAGVSAPANLDGISLVPTLLGLPDRQRRHDFLYWFYPPQRQQAVRAGRWKAVWRQGERMLFDLDADPGETTDVKAAHPEVMERLAAIAEREGGSEGTVVARWEPRLLAPAVPLSR